MRRETSGLANTTVTVVTAQPLYLQANTTVEFRVEDWCQRVLGKSWMDAESHPMALAYAVRSAMAGIPLDNEVLYGKTPDGLAHLVHISEVAS